MKLTAAAHSRPRKAGRDKETVRDPLVGLFHAEIMFRQVVHWRKRRISEKLQDSRAMDYVRSVSDCVL